MMNFWQRPITLTHQLSSLIASMVDCEPGVVVGAGSVVVVAGL